MSLLARLLNRRCSIHRVCEHYDSASWVCEWNRGGSGKVGGCYWQIVGKRNHVTFEGDGLSHQGESGITLPSDSPNPYPDREVDEYIEHKRRLAREYVQECARAPTCNKRCL